MTIERNKGSVEPLSRQAWERVEAGVFARLDRGEHLMAPDALGRSALGPARRSGQLWAGAMALAAAALIALWLRFDATPDLGAPNAQIESRGSAEPARSPSEPAPATQPPSLAAPARIVSTESPTTTTLGEAVLTLAAHSDVRMSGSDVDGWLIRLDAGQIDCQVAPRRGRPAFVVEAGETRVSVVGTRFTVTREPSSGSVSVREGHVQVDSGAVHLTLGPGESWPARSDTLATEAADADTPHADTPHADTPHARAAPEPPQLRTKASPRSARSIAAARTRLSQQRFEKAARLEQQDPAASAQIYKRLARDRGPWAANALYAQARLELDRGRPERAAPLLRRYLERYPGGVNAADVRALMLRLPQR